MDPCHFCGQNPARTWVQLEPGGIRDHGLCLRCALAILRKLLPLEEYTSNAAAAMAYEERQVAERLRWP